MDQNVINSFQLGQDILELGAEVKTSIKQIISVKSQDDNALPTEVYKYGGNLLLREFLDLFVVF